VRAVFPHTAFQLVVSTLRQALAIFFYLVISSLRVTAFARKLIAFSQTLTVYKVKPNLSKSFTRGRLCLRALLKTLNFYLPTHLPY